MTARPGSCALAVAATGAAVSAVVIIQRAGAWDLGPAPQVTVDIAVGASFSLIALVVLTSPALTPGTRTLARVLQLSGAASAGAALTTALALTATDSTPLSRSLVQLQSWLWVPGFIPLLTLVPLLYPNGLRPGRVWRVAAWASVVGIVALSVGVALYPEPFVGTVTLTKPVTSEPVAKALAAARRPPAGPGHAGGTVRACSSAWSRRGGSNDGRSPCCSARRVSSRRSRPCRGSCRRPGTSWPSWAQSS